MVLNHISCPNTCSETDEVYAGVLRMEGRGSCPVLLITVDGCQGLNGNELNLSSTERQGQARSAALLDCIELVAGQTHSPLLYLSHCAVQQLVRLARG